MVMLAPLLALAVLGASDTCGDARCDTAACPCGCECGNATDPGVCYVPAEKAPARCDEEPVAAPTVLVTGATGRLGSLLYHRLRAATHADGASAYTVRAFVRSVDKARSVLSCTKCDASEGIYIGEVNDTAALRVASLGAYAVAIAVGASPSDTPAQQKATEFTGVENQLAALAQTANLAAAGGAAGLRVVLCSSMGTTSPPGSGYGDILFWKLNAESFLAASGVPFAVVKPCGLVDTAGSNSTLLVGHDDTLLTTQPPLIARADVAALMEASLASAAPRILRFDVCSTPGAPPADLATLLAKAEYPWQQ